MTIYDDIAAETASAIKKHGWDGVRKFATSNVHKNVTILGEEFGEVCKAIWDGESPAELRAELIQVASVAARWAEAIVLDVPDETDDEKLLLRIVELCHSARPVEGHGENNCDGDPLGEGCYRGVLANQILRLIAGLDS